MFFAVFLYALSIIGEFFHAFFNNAKNVG